MNSAQFQGSAKSTPFAPLQAVDQTNAERQQLSDQLRWMREDQQLVQDDRRDYAARLSNSIRENRDFREQDLQALAGLSKSLTDTLLKVQEDKKQDDKEEGLMLQYQDGLPIDMVEKYEKDEKSLIEARDQTSQLALRQAAEGAPPDIVERIRGLSGWKLYGYQTGLAQEAGLRWGDYLAQALENDTVTKVDLGNGRVITPSEARDRPEIVAVSAVLRRKFIRDVGLIEANPALLNKYLFPNMKRGEEAVISQKNSQLVATRAQETLDEQDGILTTALLSQGDYGAAINAFVSSTISVLDPRSKSALGFPGARDRAIALIDQLGKDGKLDDTVITAIENTLVPGSTTETWGSKFPQKFIGLRDSIRAGREADLAAEERAEEREDANKVKEFLALAAQKGGFTETEKEEIQTWYQQRGKPMPSAIAQLVTVEQKDDENATEYLNSVLASGRGLTMQELMSGGYSPEIILKYRDRVSKFETGVTNNEAYKVQEKGIKAYLEGNLRVTYSQGTKPDWTLYLAQGKAVELLRKATLKNVRNGMAPDEAADAAAAEVKKLIDAGLPKNGASGIFRLPVDSANPSVAKPNSSYVGIFGNDILSKSQQKEIEFKRLRDKVNAYRANGRFLDQPLLSESDLQKLEVLRVNPSADFPASVLYLASETRNLSPWDVADKQLIAANREPLTRPPQVQWSDSIDPRLRTLLYQNQSSNRTGRAYSGTAWNPAKVPNNWGIHVEKAANKFGIDPALLAGLLAHESAGWNPNAVSRAGAVGLAQLMPGTDKEVGVTNRKDPIQSIYGGAKYLRKMMDMFNGDITAALRAYNQGPGNQQRYPGGVSSEATRYPSKVLREAAKYGYGFGQGSPFRRQEVMNPRVAYRIGNLGYGSTGPHLDVKPVLPGSMQSSGSLPAIKKNTLDKYVYVKVNGKLVPLSKGTVTTADDTAHRRRRRSSYGHDFAADDGTEVYLKNGARVVGSFVGDQGTDHLIIELPDGRRFQFLHGKKTN